MARSSKLTRPVADQIALGIKGAASFKAAAQRAGIGERTLHTWRERGRAERERVEAAQRQLEALPKRPRSEEARKARARAQRAAAPRPAEVLYMEFAEQLERADAEAQVRAAAQIAAAGAENWRAAAWLLERRDPETFGPPRSRVELAGADGAPIEIEATGLNLAALDDDELLALQGMCERSERSVSANGHR